MTITPERAADRRDPLTAQRLHSLLAPESIAIIGASDKSAWSQLTFKNLRDGGFTGNIHLVNRRGATTHGQATYTSVGELPEVPGLAVVLTSGTAVPSVLDDGAKLGISNFIVLAGGFSEGGAQGQALQDHVVATARANGQLILGPNNLGFVNTWGKVSAFSHFTPAPMLTGGVGLLSQSGALAIFLLPFLQSRDVGISHAITLGNEAMISVTDGLEYLLHDENTKVIALYVEQIRDCARFADLAGRAREAGKPIVMFKVGRGKTAARVAAAHTGALVGDDRVIDAVCRQQGVIRVESMEDLAVTAGLLDGYGEMPGHRVGFVTGSGAMCALISEKADAVSLTLPELSAETVAALREDGLPESATAQNPLDVTGVVAVDPSIMYKAQRRVLNDPDVDIAVFNSQLPQSKEHAAMSSAMAEETILSAAGSDKPVIMMGFLPVESTEFGRQWRRQMGMAHLVESYDRGVPALARAIWWSQRRRDLAAVDPVAPPAVIARPEGTGDWTEADIGAFLGGHGVPYVPATVVGSADEAVAAADGMGYPVVLKIASRDIAHKTDVGGVRLDLADGEEVRAAHNDILARVGAAQPAALISGITVSPMRGRGTELLVGVVRDPDWGLVLVVGFGGVLVEVLRDTALRVLPVSRDEVRSMLDELRGIEVLRGFRGGEAADLDAVVEAVHRIALVAEGLGDGVEELEINPLLVQGDRVEALDALIRWSDSPS
ncbi:acetate--CoA ligase family protein [Streptomyces albipurpureus]|uniref:Acetate--CoA ligase family protein n=1 Tax=Streptomyces albipurpureus TaxID=2897419 RepID=A0ABT0UMV7_9ACTN|nr:acetate--CoA ligase family protein [Streptomyces sp. CWNU-1]MCM2389642.1 acetate--CoA ligase family protein [Streptomyces sp. CWNU-1]